MVNLQKAMDIYERMPNNKAEKFLWTILCKLGEIEEGLQCSVRRQERIGCVAHVKGILPDDNIGLLKKSKANDLTHQKVCISCSLTASKLKSYIPQEIHNSPEKTPQNKLDQTSFLKIVQDDLYLLQLIIYRSYCIFLCIFLHRFVSPCQCPYIKTCELIIAQKKAKALKPMAKLIIPKWKGDLAEWELWHANHPFPVGGQTGFKEV